MSLSWMFVVTALEVDTMVVMLSPVFGFPLVWLVTADTLSLHPRERVILLMLRECTLRACDRPCQS
jgi:hypothetical protein